MIRYLRFAPLLAAVLFGFALNATADESDLQSRLRNRIEAGLSTDSLTVMDERVHARAALRRVYPARGYAPLWVAEDGPLPQAERLADWLARTPQRHGLQARDYHLAPIDALEDSDRQGALVDLELALSDAFLMVGSHLLAGRLNPETLDAEWLASRRHRDLAPLLEQAAASNDPGAVLETLLPEDPAYHALVARLAELRALRDAGGWPSIPAGPTLREGDEDPRVAALVQRLVASGELAAHDGASFDTPVVQAVRRYQARHGLTADGLVGAATLASLNAPIQERIDKLIVNLERWRWLPETLGERYIIVNIAGFKLDVVEHGASTLSMRVVVGTPFRRTPVFSEQMSYLVLNPSWQVPERIALEDKLPLIKANPGYLTQQNFTLLQGWGADERVIDPATVDWANLSRRSFASYRLRQGPGPSNALGRVKFMFPNKFSVYLHDTPARELFGRDARAFSSGCIRLERPLELAELLLRDNPAWQRPAIDRALETGREQTVRLRERMPVHLLYWTAWVDAADGVLNFRDDIYGRDTPVLRELREPPPT